MEGDHILANMRHLHSDVVQQTLEVVARLDAVAKRVVEAAQQVEQGKTLLHKQNEALLMAQVKEITVAVNQLRSVEESMQQAAAKQAVALLEPLRQEMHQHVSKLIDKNIAAAQFMNATNDTQGAVAKSLEKAVIGAIFFGFILFAAGVGIGHLWH